MAADKRQVCDRNFVPSPRKGGNCPWHPQVALNIDLSCRYPGSDRTAHPMTMELHSSPATYIVTFLLTVLCSWVLSFFIFALFTHFLTLFDTSCGDPINKFKEVNSISSIIFKWLGFLRAKEIRRLSWRYLRTRIIFRACLFFSTWWEYPVVVKNWGALRHYYRRCWGDSGELNKAFNSRSLYSNKENAY